MSEPIVPIPCNQRYIILHVSIFYTRNKWRVILIALSFTKFNTQEEELIIISNHNLVVSHALNCLGYIMIDYSGFISFFQSVFMSLNMSRFACRVLISINIKSCTVNTCWYEYTYMPRTRWSTVKLNLTKWSTNPRKGKKDDCTQKSII